MIKKINYLKMFNDYVNRIKTKFLQIFFFFSFKKYLRECFIKYVLFQT